MWTGELIAQALGWGVLICGFPLIFIFTRKVVRHISYSIFPREVIIQYKTEDEKTESYLLSGSFLRKRTLKRISEVDAKMLGGSL